MKDLHEECGVFGLYAPEVCDLANMVYYGLYALQHRGQESCGIVVNDDGVFSSLKDLGLVNEVFNKDNLRKFPKGRIAVGHARYGTTARTGPTVSQSRSITRRARWLWLTTATSVMLMS